VIAILAGAKKRSDEQSLEVGNPKVWIWVEGGREGGSKPGILGTAPQLTATEQQKELEHNRPRTSE
jgi:hypothetical protein